MSPCTPVTVVPWLPTNPNTLLPLAPRPQVRFLEYIRQWEKKVVFVVNKSDILQGREEVEAVKQFVSANAQRILRLDRPAVIAVGGAQKCCKYWKYIAGYAGVEYRSGAPCAWTARQSSRWVGCARLRAKK